ncbi:hypothetical protein ACLB90_05300 [Stenotrophomonas sp. LGBM10]|uniref:hypothetical protein n=1 Tax=Stenotrophomonas sp. LGBM10 TaxID=3390038 RepID=UPI00398B78F2
MFFRTGRIALLCAVAAQMLVPLPYVGIAHAQPDDYRPGWNQHDRDDRRDDRRRHERERDRRDDDKATGVVVGVVATAVVAGVIAAAAKRERETRERTDYCIQRYGNYDRRSDSYRAANGYTYPCR